MLNRILAILLIVFLGLTLISELANLIGFRSQEIYLNHPDYPEGEKYKADLAAGKLELIIWTILTAGSLMMIIISLVKKRIDWLNWVALLIFVLATYLPILIIINGLIFRGIVFGIITLGLAGLIILKMIKENTRHNIS